MQVVSLWQPILSTLPVRPFVDPAAQVAPPSLVVTMNGVPGYPATPPPTKQWLVPATQFTAATSMVEVRYGVSTSPLAGLHDAPPSDEVITMRPLSGLVPTATQVPVPEQERSWKTPEVVVAVLHAERLPSFQGAKSTGAS